MATTGYMVTDTVGSIEILKTISNGNFKINIDNYLVDIVGVDFTRAQDYNDIATILTSSLNSAEVGGFTNAKVTSSSSTGSAQLTFTSGSQGRESDVSRLKDANLENGVDISGREYLNGLSGNQLLSIDVYTVDATDIDSINLQNSSHANPFLSIMNFYDQATSSWSGVCIQQDIIESPEYLDWYNALNAIKPFVPNRQADLLNLILNNN